MKAAIERELALRCRPRVAGDTAFWVLAIVATIIFLVVKTISTPTLLESFRRMAIPLPVKVVLRQSQVSTGYVAQLTDTGETPITVGIKCGESGKQLTLDPNKTEEIGWLEGVPIHSGETVEVWAPGGEGYKSVTIQAP